MTAEPMQLACPVFFVGFMGAGKTSVARRLARTCGISSVDMDTYLERREGKRVKEIFAEGGEDAFRAIETDVLRELASKEEPLVISCGGGVVLREENREILAESGFVVHLQVTVHEAASRISDKSSRPLFQDIDAARQRCLERALCIRVWQMWKSTQRVRASRESRARSSAHSRKKAYCASDESDREHPR